jgi:hypothetical protein
MPDRTSTAPPNTVRAVRSQLIDADDEKIGRVLALLDKTGDSAASEALLAPLRTRLATLKPARPIRFARLLFLPLDPLIETPRNWRPGRTALPRSAIRPMASVVRAALGDEVRGIEAQIAEHTTDAPNVIEATGSALWSRAAAVLQAAAVPPEWAQTGLKPSLYPVLAGAVAAVLRRATMLRGLVRDADLGALPVDDRALRQLLLGLEQESAEGCAMVASLVMLQLPQAVSSLARLLPGVVGVADRLRVNKAVDQALDHVLSQMEQPSGRIQQIGSSELGQAGAEVRRIVNLLQDLEAGGAAGQHRQRIRSIRDQLVGACQARFTEGLQRDVLMQLPGAVASAEGTGQRQLEATTRGLRTLEQSARKLGDGRAYDRLLSGAVETVRAMGQTGSLSLSRRARLVEILAGPDAAEALYREQAPARR